VTDRVLEKQENDVSEVPGDRRDAMHRSDTVNSNRLRKVIIWTFQ